VELHRHLMLFLHRSKKSADDNDEFDNNDQHHDVHDDCNKTSTDNDDCYLERQLLPLLIVLLLRRLLLLIIFVQCLFICLHQHRYCYQYVPTNNDSDTVPSSRVPTEALQRFSLIREGLILILVLILILRVAILTKFTWSNNNNCY